MNAQNFLASFDVGKVHRDLSIKTAGTKQSRIQDVGTVGCGDNDYPFLRVKPVHFNEQSIQRLFALIMAAAEAMPAVTSNGVDLINKNDTRCRFLSLFKHVAHS